ncbi:DNA polymerase thumb domain-containing protein [Lentilactobacillus sp. SPB1-3]|uniref:Excinuclease ABC subunit A n=1 Tax=Lentilactobacillus terminaliae TaxID=3003483 RepID=A0ACD5DGH1_9LACO|nr:excinuclease ABC subunit A [Lentilactobacillus sp. SPB1-3]MCZ0976965.1 excinuclease ABC subunit A [Lentilactobacillus sp. SPB1-3]
MYDYSKEPRKVIFMIDSKSFYASCESVSLHMNPLKSILIVMSQAENTNGGLVLAASPLAKKLLGVRNVMRKRDVPQDPRLIVVQPRMNYYIQENIRINDIFKQYTPKEDWCPYSIDESLLDMTHSWHLYGESPYEVARKIQLQVKRETGIYLTVGIGDNPLLAKLALDLEAKKSRSLIGEWHYEDVPDKLWPVTELSDVWSIGHATADKLKHLNIHSMEDLAHYNPYKLADKIGKVAGGELFALAWGIDRSIISQRYSVKEKSYSNSQVLPRDYQVRSEIELVIKELADQVASRIRKHRKKARVVSLYVGLSYADHDKGNHGFSRQMKIEPTNNSKELIAHIMTIFRENWHGEVVRNIGVTYGNLIDDTYDQLNLFQSPKDIFKARKVDETMDSIRRQFGFTKLVRLSSLQKGGTAIKRAGLVGGHNGGNSYE